MIKTKSSITILNSHLYTGGVATVCFELYQLLSANGHSVDIINTDNLPINERFTIDQVDIQNLKLMTSKYSRKSRVYSIFNNFKNLCSTVRHVLRKSHDVVICIHFVPILIAFLCQLFDKKRIYIFCIHTDIDSYIKNSSFVKKYVLKLFQKLLDNSNCKKVYLSNKSLANNNYVIPNVYKPKYSLGTDVIDSRRILYVGRISKEKNVDFIIKVYAEYIKAGGDCKLDIVGDGDYFEVISSLVIELKLEKEVILHGHSDDVEKFYISSTCLFCASSYEGFGMTILEAIDRRLPVISSNCKSGPSLILTGNGLEFEQYIRTSSSILLPSPGNDSMDVYLEALFDITNYGKVTLEDRKVILDRFSEKNIYNLWEHIL